MMSPFMLIIDNNLLIMSVKKSVTIGECTFKISITDTVERKVIYRSGITDVYTNKRIYPTLKNKGGNCDLMGPALFVIDDRNPSCPRIITTTIRTVSCGRGDSFDLSTTEIDDQKLTLANHISFSTTVSFHAWLEVILKDQKLIECVDTSESINIKNDKYTIK